ncbi:MAG: GGDEF domain-containing protein [Proteobacteria bacterium]|nr:GGDEF domain-containing protein [Pseudomonadota bacterium]
MSALTNFIKIIGRHPLTSIFDLSLAAFTMSGAVALALAYDLEAMWSDMTPRERHLCGEEIVGLAVLLGVCVTIFIWRRLLEDRQDRARWQRTDAELQEQRFLAKIDPLTGLANRREFLRTLEDCIAADTAASVLLLDLNGFKQINDTYGHAVGDDVLKAVAGRFSEAARSDDVVARLGGDEFSVLVRDLSDQHQVRQIGRRFAKVLAEPILVDGHQHSVGVAVGIANWPDDGATAAALLKKADAAMYHAKRSTAYAMSFFDGNAPRLEDVGRVLSQNAR